MSKTVPYACAYALLAYVVLIGVCASAVAQTHISGTINRYSKVTAIHTATRTIILSDASIFRQAELPDTVLLIQMTGIRENGTIDDTNAGRYEFHVVTKIEGNAATLQTAPGSFTVSELVQAVRVPSFKDATILSGTTLHCDTWKWASGTGGILALMVDGTLTLNGNIDVSGRGFNGGAASTVYAGECSFAPPYDAANYPVEASDRAGNKGEGAVLTSYYNPGVSNDNIRGYGRTWNGGGGGNGKWSGGGGGANGGDAGSGDDQACSGVRGHNTSTGNKGSAIKYEDMRISERAFMGGGGGAGTGIGTAGGNGGGIVIIVAQKLQFAANAAIMANGASVEGAPSEAGAGGGGAGGSVLLSAADYGYINVEIAGGNGGNVNRIICEDTNYSIGAGGGGSGGLLLTTIDMTDVPNIKKGGGNNGTISANFGRCPTSSSGPGQPGICRGGFQVPLRGFLRNYIVSSKLTTCYDQPITIEASQPQGGSSTYRYSWQSAPNNKDWTTIPGEDGNSITLSFTKDTWLRRVVTSGSMRDTSASVSVVVEIPVNTAVAPVDTTVCWKETLVVRGSIPTPVADVPCTFQWKQQVNDAWTDIADATGKDLTAPLQTTGGDHIYKRLVISTATGCVYEGNISTIRVHSPIANNVLTPDHQEICDDHAQELIGTAPTGGVNTYKYQWQINTEGMDWTNIADAVEINYQPLVNTSEIAAGHQYDQDRHYRRYITSGKCNSTSNELTVHFDAPASLATMITPNGDQTGFDALKYKFNETIQAATPDVGNGLWSSPDETVGFTPSDQPTTTVDNLKLGTNTVVWTVTNGVCPSESVSTIIEVMDITIPNGFSPNGDHINECFRVVGGENVASCEVVILDRYNNVVFESKSFQGSSNLNDCSGWWDGRNAQGKELPTGTYFYQVILNGDKVYKGYVVLKNR